MKPFRRPTSLERRWLRKRAVCIRIRQSIDAGIVEADDRLLSILADVSRDEAALRVRVELQEQRRYCSFLCGRRKSNKQLDPRCLDVRYPRAEAMPLLLAGRSQPVCTREGRGCVN